MDVAYGLERLGDPTGKTEIEWADTLRRNPDAITYTEDGNRLLEWSSGRWDVQRVVALFDAEGTFIRITHRYRC